MRDAAAAAPALAGAVLRVGSFGVTASRRLLPPCSRLRRPVPGAAVEVREGATTRSRRGCANGWWTPRS
jgi:hypothetical protein